MSKPPNNRREFLKVTSAAVAVADGYRVDEHSPLYLAAPGLLENDTDEDEDSLGIVLITEPAHAQHFTYDNKDGSFMYVPTAGFTGTDTFTYKANDGADNSQAVTVTITVGDSRYPGDANLDGTTDVRDFMLWNAYKFTEGTTWEQGDFDLNGVTDVRDFMIWNVHKFTSASDPAPVLTQAVDDVFSAKRVLPTDLAWLSEWLDSASAQDDDEKSDEVTDKVLALYW